MPAGAVGPENAAEMASDSVVFVDLQAAGTALLVRGRRPGDRFHPLGSGGSCRLKKFLIDRKVPRHRRDRIPLVLTAAGRIVWVVGYRIGDAFKLRAGGRQAIRLSAEPVTERQEH